MNPDISISETKTFFYIPVLLCVYTLLYVVPALLCFVHLIKFVHNNIIMLKPFLNGN